MPLFSVDTKLLYSLTFPETILVKKFHRQAQNHQILSLTVSVITALILGPLKLLTIPLALAAGGSFLACKFVLFSPMPLSSFLTCLVCLLGVAAVISLIAAAAILPPALNFFTLSTFIALLSSLTFLNTHKEVHAPLLPKCIPLKNLKTQKK